MTRVREDSGPDAGEAQGGRARVQRPPRAAPQAVAQFPGWPPSGSLPEGTSFFGFEFSSIWESEFVKDDSLSGSYISNKWFPHKTCMIDLKKEKRGNR